MNILPEKKISLLNEAIRNMDKLTDELNRVSIEMVNKEYKYKTKYREELLKWRTRGRNEPANVAIGLAEGEESVAELKKEYDLDKYKYEILKEKLKNEKMQIEVLRSTLAYDRATYQNM